VLLVDGNLRRPGLKGVFPNVPRDGLSNILIGEGKLAACVIGSGHPLLDVLGSGPVPPNPVELLAGPHWRNFLSEATEKYEQVIIDTPPALLASDAVVLSTSVDGVILVVRAKRDSRGVARRAWCMLSDVHARIFGAVLNAAQVARGGYYRQQLRAYYDYQHDVDGTGQHRPPART
jgi:capsular exopolysaccharide synthesis family protein